MIKTDISPQQVSLKRLNEERYTIKFCKKKYNSNFESFSTYCPRPIHWTELYSDDGSPLLVHLRQDPHILLMYELRDGILSIFTFLYG